MATAKQTTGKSRFRLSEMRAKRAESFGGKYVELEDDDGTVLARVPRMGFWDAQTYEDIVTSGELFGDLHTLERVMEPAEFKKLKGLGLEVGDMKDLIGEVMRMDPEAKGSSTR